MAGTPKVVLFFSNLKISEAEATAFSAAGFSPVFSKGKARLVDEIMTLRPVAVVVDARYCIQRTASASFLLPKIKKSLNGAPVFLINSTCVRNFDLLKANLAYAILPHETSMDKLLSALLNFCMMIRGVSESNRIRHKVSVPCLVKRLGTSGLVKGQICDLSPKGMKIVVDLQPVDWSAGDELRFSFAKAGASTQHFEGHGQLRWSVTDELGPGIKVTRMGLEFSQLPTATLVEFMQILNTARGEARLTEISA
jgi:hypothetical protein